MTDDYSRTLAIGDIHGCANALSLVLAMVQPTPADTVIVLGDIVDRGSDTKGAIEQLLTLRQTCKVIVIEGNHEEMMLGALNGSFFMMMWLENGGQATLDSYGGSAKDIPREHLRFLTTTEPLYETDTEIFIHANLEAGVPLRQQSKTFLRWKHLGGSERPHASGKRIVCGHTPQHDGVPLVLDGWLDIDTFAHGGGYLTCFDATNDLFYQAAESGLTRTFPLNKLQGRPSLPNQPTLTTAPRPAYRFARRAAQEARLLARFFR